MSTSKKAALIFLAVINVMNLAAGVIVNVKLMFNQDVTSVLPITAELSVTQILLLNFVVVTTIMFLICVVVTYLVTDIPYSPIEIIRNCPQLALLPLIIIAVAAIYNTATAEGTADTLCVLASMILYLFYNVVNFGTMVTIKEDAD